MFIQLGDLVSSTLVESDVKSAPRKDWDSYEYIVGDAGIENCAIYYHPLSDVNSSLCGALLFWDRRSKATSHSFL